MLLTEKSFKSLFNSLKEGVAVIDFDGKVRYCNYSYRQILGFEEEELIGARVVDLIVPSSRREEFYKRLEARKLGLEEDYETEVTTKSGEKIWVDIKSRNLQNDDGIPYAYLVSINDITLRKVHLENLLAFTGSAAHDLNSPLGRIIGLVSVMDMNALADEHKTILGMIGNTAQSMQELLSDLLAYTRFGAARLEKKPVDIDSLVREICKVLTPAKFHGQITIHSLPAGHGNESALRQVFTNLVSNAIKYSSKKERTEIEIGANTNAGAVVFYVKDNGVGIKKEYLSQLFTPFRRFHNDFDGNGLGLPIVKRVVEKHGGNIWVESQPGHGTTFLFTLAPER